MNGALGPAHGTGFRWAVLVQFVALGQLYVWRQVAHALRRTPWGADERTLNDDRNSSAVSSGNRGTNQAEPGDHNDIAFVGQQFAHSAERCPTHLVDFVVGSELSTHSLHRPVADSASATATVGVANLGKLLLGCTSEPGLLDHFPERTLQCRFVTMSPPLRQRPVLAVRSMDYQHLVVTRAHRSPDDPTCGFDHVDQPTLATDRGRGTDLNSDRLSVDNRRRAQPGRPCRASAALRLQQWPQEQ